MQLEIAQAPDEQVGVAFARVHVVPQEPQSVTVRMLVSQPLAELPSQSSKPGAQVETRHVPVEQSPVPPEGEQSVPHEPQFAFVVSAVSHPFDDIESQFP